MTLFLIIAYILIVDLGVLFYYLNKRVDAFTKKLNDFGGGMQTLRDNQDILMSDIKKLRNEFHSNKKESKKEIFIRRTQ